jgi:hypothetical protein
MVLADGKALSQPNDVTVGTHEKEASAISRGLFTFKPRENPDECLKGHAVIADSMIL